MKYVDYKERRLKMKKENELDAEYLLTIFNEFWNSPQEGSIMIAVKGTKPIVVSNALIFDYIKNNIDVGNYRNEYEVFKHFVLTLIENSKKEKIKND